MPIERDANKEVDELLREKAELEAKVKHLEHDVYKLQLERDILKKTGDILKKEKGISLDKLTNREKSNRVGGNSLIESPSSHTIDSRHIRF